jgi:hypothetical protein
MVDWHYASFKAFKISEPFEFVSTFSCLKILTLKKRLYDFGVDGVCSLILCFSSYYCYYYLLEVLSQEIFEFFS